MSHFGDIVVVILSRVAHFTEFQWCLLATCADSPTALSCHQYNFPNYLSSVLLRGSAAFRSFVVPHLKADNYLYTLLAVSVSPSPFSTTAQRWVGHPELFISMKWKSSWILNISSEVVANLVFYFFLLFLFFCSLKERQISLPVCFKG